MPTHHTESGAPGHAVVPDHKQGSRHGSYHPLLRPTKEEAPRRHSSTLTMHLVTCHGPCPGDCHSGEPPIFVLGLQQSAISPACDNHTWPLQADALKPRLLSVQTLCFDNSGNWLVRAWPPAGTLALQSLSLSACAPGSGSCDPAAALTLWSPVTCLYIIVPSTMCDLSDGR